MITLSITARKAAAAFVMSSMVVSSFATVIVPVVANADASNDCSGSIPGSAFSVYQHISNDPDSANNPSGNNWALDTFTRHIQIWTEGDHNCAQADDHGTFVTNGTFSPQSGNPLVGGITGSMNGGTGRIFIPAGNTFNSSATIPASIDCSADSTSAAICSNGLTGFWMNAYFGTTFDYSNWSWTYTSDVCNYGSWTNSTVSTGDIAEVSGYDCPEALNQHLTTDAGVALTVTLTSHPHDLDYSISTFPHHGTLSCATGDADCTDEPLDSADVTYTPDAGYVGNDSFDFTASNGDVQFDNDATIYITVNPAPIVIPPTTQTSQTVVVSPSAMNGWVFVDDQTNGAGTGSMVTGPATAPLGTGSANLTATSTTDGQVLEAAYPGVKFANLTSLNYSTYQDAANTSTATAIALQFNVAQDATNVASAWQGRIVYEPYNNNGGTVPTGTWTTWDALSGGAAKWWFSKPSAFGNNCPQSAPCTMTQIITLFPNIGVNGNPTLGAVVLKAGSGWSAFSGNVDKLSIGVTDGSNATTTTYDFEPAAATTTGGGSGSGSGSGGSTTHNPECSDGIDNDNDGRADYPADNSCSDAGDNSEGNDGGSGGGSFSSAVSASSGSIGGGVVLGASTDIPACSNPLLTT